MFRGKSKFRNSKCQKAPDHTLDHRRKSGNNRKKQERQRPRCKNKGKVKYESLPLEIWDHIFSFLTDRKTLTRISMVSSNWHTLAQRYLKSLSSYQILFCTDMISVSTIVLTKNGRLYAWGNNKYGQLGLGDTVPQQTPQIVSFFKDKKIMAIYHHFFSMFAVTDNGLYTWGENGYGQLGLGDKKHRYTPQIVSSFKDKNIINIVGYDGSIFALTDNGLYTWGRNRYGVLGLDDNKPRYTPQIVSSLKEKKVIAIKARNHTIFAITDEGDIYVWGNLDDWNAHLLIKTGINDEKSYIPKFIYNLKDENVTAVVSGRKQVVALTKKGHVYIWGHYIYDSYGLLDKFKSKVFKREKCPLIPVPVLEREEIIDIVGGRWVRCVFALTKNGRVYGWRGTREELGFGNSKYQSEKYQHTPTIISALKHEKIINIVIGFSHIVALTHDGRVYVWGENRDGQLGLGDTAPRYSPQIVSFFNNIKITAIYASEYSTFFVTDGEQIYACGQNKDSLLGLKTKDSQVLKPSIIQHFNFFSGSRVSPSSVSSQVQAKTLGIRFNSSG